MLRSVFVAIVVTCTLSGCLTEDELGHVGDHSNVDTTTRVADVDVTAQSVGSADRGDEPRVVYAHGDEHFVMVAPVSFRPQTHFDTSGHLLPKSVAMPSYLGGSGIKPSMAPYPTFPNRMSLLAAVALPDGARVTSFECYVKDTDPRANLDRFSLVSLKRRTPAIDTGATLSYQYFGTEGVTGTATISPSVNTSYATIDNSQHQYTIEARLRYDARPSYFGILFRGCRVGFVHATAEP